MNKKVDLNEFLEWAKEGTEKSVTIDINRLNLDKHISIWVYDYSKMQGQYVSSVDEIDLDEEKSRREKELYKRLKAKFGDV